MYGLQLHINVTDEPGVPECTQMDGTSQITCIHCEKVTKKWGGSTIFVRLNTTEDNIAYHSKIKHIGLHMSLLPLKRMD